MGSTKSRALTAALALASGLFSPGAFAKTDEIECPKGTYRVMTDNPYDPFRCESAAQERRAGAEKLSGGPEEGPKCPRGTRPVPAPGGLQRHRCVSARPRPAEPEVPVLPAEGAPASERDYRRITLEDEAVLDIPEAWRVTDGWRDEVPTLYAELPTGKAGRRVTMVVSKISAGQPDYAAMGAAISREKEWQKAKDGGRGEVAGLPARFTFVPKESRTAYVKKDAGTYYTLAYSAPSSLFAAYAPAYDRLLKSFRLVGAGRAPEDSWSSKSR